MDYGLGAFFKKYDYFFKAHEVPITLDYPLSDNVFFLYRNREIRKISY
ncbi:DUF6179 domain-containing protein [Clostridium sp. HCP1S3_B4]